MEQTLSQSNVSPHPISAPRGLNRCRARNRTGSQCRLPAQDLATGLCSRHAARVRRTTDTAPDRADLSADLFGPTTPTFDSPEEINRTLAHLVILVAQGRISTRRAAVITYALSFILRGLQAIDKKAADASGSSQIIIDIDSAVARRALVIANTSEAHRSGEGMPREGSIGSGA